MQQSSSSNRQAKNRNPNPDNVSSGCGPIKLSRSSSFAEKISSWSKRNKSTDHDMSDQPPASAAYMKPIDGTKENKPSIQSSVKGANFRSKHSTTSKDLRSSNYPTNNDKVIRSSSVRLVEGISKVNASGTKSHLHPPRADETVVTASTASVSIQNSMSADDEPTFYAKACTNLLAKIVDGKKIPETLQRSLPYKNHSFPVGNNTFNIDTRYNLVKVIGSGAYGVVISASDSCSNGDNKNVAIKMVPKAFQDEVDAKRILREIKLLQHFQHDNIVSIIDMMPSLVTRNIEEFNDVYIVTDLMETDLHRIIYSKQSLSADHTQYFVYQILRALKYIHSANVLHRDLKPSNVLVNANCDLKICDFGLARGIHLSNQDCEDCSMELDGIGLNPNVVPSVNNSQLLTEYVVTRWYRAPEIMLACRQYSKPVDVWSVGCIMAELLGRKPFLPGNDYIEQLTLITKKLGKLPEHEQDFVSSEKAKRFLSKFPDVKPPSLSSQFPGVQPDAIDLLAKMLTVHPRKRITVNQALEHPYFATLHSIDDEPVADRPFDFSFEDEKLYRVRIQELIWNEVCHFRPSCLPLPPRRDPQNPDRR